MKVNSFSPCGILLKRFFSVLVLVFWGSAGLAQFSGTSADAIMPGHLIVKLESDHAFDRMNKSAGTAPGSRRLFSREQSRTDVETMLQTFGLERMDRVMTAAALNEFRIERLQKNPSLQGTREITDDLSRTFIVEYSADVDPWFVASKVSGVPGVAYAEPRMIMELAYIPNDPLYNQAGQSYFAYQNFLNAWDVSKSSRDIVIAIVDSGVDYTHNDLSPNLWRNDDPGRARRFFPDIFNEVVNDTIGWNFWATGPASNAVQNGDPKGTAQSHGTHVAGIAAAVSDNGIGIASAGFNSTYMAVRVGGTEEAPRAIGFGYEGILYAAVNGADIINCSFGSASYSQFGEDVVNFATGLGSVIIGAAGNSDNDDYFYPAAYENVLSVASVVNNTGEKSGFSSYGSYVDVAATGTVILSTVFNNQYSLNSGTSMAAPVAAGLAALVRHQFPDWGPERVIGQIRGTANGSVYASNAGYADKLGKGLIDAHKAVTEPVPYIRILSSEFVNEAGSKLGLDEQGFMDVVLVNYGTGTQNLTYEITNSNGTATILGPNGIIGPAGTGNEVTFRIPVRLTDEVLFGRIPSFKVIFRDIQSGYSDYRFIQYDNLFVDTHDANRVHVSATSSGAIGFNRTTEGTSGVGFVPYYEIGGSLVEVGNLLYESGLIIETNIDEKVHLMSNVRETNIPQVLFRPNQLFSIQEAQNGDQTGYAMFTPDIRPGFPGMNIEMKTYAFTDPALSKSLLVYYTIENVDPSRLALNDTYVGLFADWDIGNYSNNNVFYRGADSLLVVNAPDSPYPFVTIAHLGGISSAFAINNAYTGVVDSLNFGIYYSAGSATNVGFLDQYKSWSLKAGLGKTQQFSTDVSAVSASGPFTIRYGQKIQVGFVYAFGETIEELSAQVSAARQRNVMTSTPNFNQPRVPVFVPDELAVSGNYPNPFNPATVIVVDVDRPGRAVLEVYDIMGRKVGTIMDENLNNRRYEIPFDAGHLAGGVYVVVLRTERGVRTRKITLLK